MTNYRHVKVTDIREGMKRPYWDYANKKTSHRTVLWWDVVVVDGKATYVIHHDNGHAESLSGEGRIAIVDDEPTDTQARPATRSIGIHEAEAGMKWVYALNAGRWHTRTIAIVDKRVDDRRTNYTLTFADGTTYHGDYGTTITILDK